MAIYNFNVREGHLERFIFPDVPSNGAIWSVKTKTHKTDSTYANTFTDLVLNGTTLQWNLSANATNVQNFPAYYDLISTVGAVNTTIHSGYIEFEEAPYDPNGEGVIKHSDLVGLNQDDHTQYHTDARGDARYYTKTVADTRFARTVNNQPIDASGNVDVSITVDESNFVHKTGSETIVGSKSFTGGLNSNGSAVVTTNDTRLTNARTPTAHKSTHATGGSDVLLPTDIGAAPVDSRWKPNTPLVQGQTVQNAGVWYTANIAFTTPATFNTTNLTAGQTVPNGTLTSAAFDTGTAAAIAAFSATVQVITPTLVSGVTYQATIDLSSGTSSLFKLTIPDGVNVVLNLSFTNIPAVGTNISRLASVDIIQNTQGTATVNFMGASGYSPDMVLGSQFRNRYTVNATDGFYTAKLDDVVPTPTLDQTFQTLGAEFYYDLELNAGLIELDKSGKMRNATYGGTAGTDFVIAQPSLTTAEPNGKAVLFNGTAGYLAYGDGSQTVDWFDLHSPWTLMFLIKTPSTFSDPAWVQANSPNRALFSMGNVQAGGAANPWVQISTNNVAPYQALRVYIKDNQGFTIDTSSTSTFFDSRKVFGAVVWDPTNNGANATGTYNTGTAFTGLLKMYSGSPSLTTVTNVGSTTAAIPANSTISGTGITIAGERFQGAMIPNTFLNTTIDKILLVKGKDITASLNSYYQAMK